MVTKALIRGKQPVVRDVVMGSVVGNDTRFTGPRTAGNFY